jgi:hypothetical protein
MATKKTTKMAFSGICLPTSVPTRYGPMMPPTRPNGRKSDNCGANRGRIKFWCISIHSPPSSKVMSLEIWERASSRRSKGTIPANGCLECPRRFVFHPGAARRSIRPNVQMSSRAGLPPERLKYFTQHI